MKTKTAASQASWALLTEGVSASRLEVHRIQHMVARVLKLVESSENKDHLYQVAGDVIEGLPKRLTSLETSLDRTGLALSKMGIEFLESRLPLSEKTLVDETLEAASAQQRHSAQRVVARYLRGSHGTKG